MNPEDERSEVLVVHNPSGPTSCRRKQTRERWHRTELGLNSATTEASPCGVRSLRPHFPSRERSDKRPR
ncbi:hypothetical protein BN903_309 [Halorubrum sp. AJ67]|nr:hypothetical protein BN903_309 [Halorubrum sp. AJ67]